MTNNGSLGQCLIFIECCIQRDQGCLACLTDLLELVDVATKLTSVTFRAVLHVLMLEITLIKYRENKPERCYFGFKLLLTADVLLTRTTFVDSTLLHITLQLSTQIFDFLFQVPFACLSFHERFACFRELLCLANTN